MPLNTRPLNTETVNALPAYSTFNGGAVVTFRQAVVYITAPTAIVTFRQNVILHETYTSTDGVIVFRQAVYSVMQSRPVVRFRQRVYNA